MKAEQITHLLAVIEADKRLNAWHIALLAALVLLAIRQGRTIRIMVSRSILMRLSHIRTLPTYHKYFRELQSFGYFIYRPSYHPVTKSEIDFEQRLFCCGASQD